VRAIPCGDPTEAPEGIGFADGVQRWSVEGHFGIVPVVHAEVAAGVLVRERGRLRCAVRHAEEFLIVPEDRLDPALRSVVEAVGLPVHPAEAPRPHPLVDRWAAAQVVEARREALEHAVCREFLAETSAPLIVDGGLAGLAGASGADRAVGVVKQHETQFLDGDDLTVALTLPEGYRSSVFARTLGDGTATHSWYLRLWAWSGEDLLHGLARVEQLAGDRDADRVSRWLLAERAPIAGRDPRWDRLLYPIHEVEMVLRAHWGGW
jgi:hypothetical protein